MTVMNTGAGHSIPSGDPSHQVELRFTVLDSAGAIAKDGEPRSMWLRRTVEPEPPFVQVSDERLEAASSRVFDFEWTAHKKLDPGSYTLVVSTHWWSVSPERATGLGLGEDLVRVDVAEQRVQLRID